MVDGGGEESTDWSHTEREATKREAIRAKKGVKMKFGNGRLISCF